MARIVKYVTVCDEGGERCDNSELHKVRLTIDGKTRNATVCSKHLTPWLRLHDKHAAPSARGRVYSIQEVKQQRK